MGNFMRAYTIAFETSNGEQVASRAIIPFFKKIQEILKDSPQNVIRRINGKIMRVHAYEWNHMNEDYLVVLKWSRVISVYSGVLRRGRRANRYRKHSRKKKVCIE